MLSNTPFFNRFFPKTYECLGVSFKILIVEMSYVLVNTTNAGHTKIKFLHCMNLSLKEIKRFYAEYNIVLSLF